MEDTLIIISSLKYAYDIRKLIEEKFPELKLKVFIDNDTPVKDDEDVKENLDFESLLEEWVKTKKKENDDATPSMPNPYDPMKDIILMYGCPITPFHTISSAEDTIRSKDFNSDFNSNTNTNAKNEI